MAFDTVRKSMFQIASYSEINNNYFHKIDVEILKDIRF